jgi:uncharacterized protein (TIGR02265 family)
MLSLVVPPALAPVAQLARPVLPDADKYFRYPAEDLLAGLPAPLTARQQAILQAEFGPGLGQPTCSLAVMLRLLDWIALVAYPDLPRGEARRRHGRASTLAWSQRAILGRVLMAAVPLMGLERVLRRLPSSIGGLTNFATRTIYCQGPGHWWYTASDDPTPPELTAGAIDAVGTLTGARQLTVQWVTPSRHDRVFELRWTP